MLTVKYYKNNLPKDHVLGKDHPVINLFYKNNFLFSKSKQNLNHGVDYYIKHGEFIQELLPMCDVSVEFYVSNIEEYE